MKNSVEYILFLGLSNLTRLLGLNLSRKFSFLLALLFYYCIPIRKETVIENLKNAFPSYSKKKINKIAFDCFRSFTITLVEILYMPYMSAEEMKKMISCCNSNLMKKTGLFYFLLIMEIGNMLQPR